MDAHAVGAVLVALASCAGVPVGAVLLAVVVPEAPVLLSLLVRHLARPTASHPWVRHANNRVPRLGVNWLVTQWIAPVPQLLLAELRCL